MQFICMKSVGTAHIIQLLIIFAAYVYTKNREIFKQKQADF